MPTAAKSTATVAQYLAALPPERRKVVAAVREVIRANLPAGYREGVAWGMIGWSVPLERLPDTYNGQPLGYVMLAAQKNAYSLHLMGVYDPRRAAAFRARWEKTGRRLDMGKACVRFKTLEDLPLDVIAAEVASIPIDRWIEMYCAVRQKPAARKKA
jgi:hypothetical protein